MQLFERLREERERLGLNQTAFAAVVGATRKTLFNWESGAGSPTAEALEAWARHGLDPLYVITGQRAGGVKPAPTLSADEEELLALFRAAPLAVKAAAIGALQGGASAKPASQKARSGGINVGGAVSGIVQTNTGHGSVQIGQMGGPPTPKRKPKE